MSFLTVLLRGRRSGNRRPTDAVTVSTSGLVDVRVARCFVHARDLAADLEPLADRERRFDAQPLDLLGLPSASYVFDRDLVRVRDRGLALGQELTRALDAALDVDLDTILDVVTAHTLACDIAQVRSAVRGCVLARDLVDRLDRAHNALARGAANPATGPSRG